MLPRLCVLLEDEQMSQIGICEDFFSWVPGRAPLILKHMENLRLALRICHLKCTGQVTITKKPPSSILGFLHPPMAENGLVSQLSRERTDWLKPRSLFGQS